MDAQDRPRQPKQLWLIPRQGRAERQTVADVAVDLPHAGIRPFAVPENLRADLTPGCVVRVALRRGREAAGFCVRVSEGTWDQTLGDVRSVVRREPLLTPPLIELALWVAEYYRCPAARALRAVLPSAAGGQALRRVRYLRRTGSAVPARPTAAQRALLELLSTDAVVRRADALARAGVRPATLRRLIAAGAVEQIERREPDESLPDEAALRTRDPDAPEDRFTLTPGQSAALARIVAGLDPPRFEVLVLFGVPGSGKTEVYVRAAREALARGRQAIIVVPEVALAAQMVERLTRRFDGVCVLHARLTPAERARALRAIHAGQAQVVIGTRTAVFAPCRALGLIVVDEEQEHSLKNLAAPRYHARDTAVRRGQIEGVPVVLGSATPALETWHNAQTLPHYHRLTLPQRVAGAQPPEVRVVATTDRGARPAEGLISPELHDALCEALADGEQAILLHNRRGYAAYLRCKRCGLTVACEQCGTHLVYHRAEDAMKCHLCGRRSALPAACADRTCDGALAMCAPAIQRLEEELERLLPRARVLRLDSDAVRRRGAAADVLRRFERREADVLIGTQMVAKGLDFSAVRLAGVIEADASLWLPDFRAAERTFQLVAQVVGRAGRREGPSLAVVQTSAAALPVIRYAVRLDYEGFAREELARRQRFFYPPFARMVRWVCSDPQPGRARRAAEALADALRACAARVHAGIVVSEASACVAARQRGMFRWQVLARAPRDGSAQRLLNEAAAARLFRTRAKRLVVDVDPVDLL